MVSKLLMRGVIGSAAWLFMGSSAVAMCIWFAPPERLFAPATNMKTLIVRDEGEVTMTVQPQFSGDATDFALVMPFPSEPTVIEAPEKIFTQLEDLTNPELAFDDVVALNFAEEAGGDGQRAVDQVRVIEERDVGDFSTVTLSATSDSALITWLNNEGYEIPDAKKETIGKYVDSNGYFAALKVNMDEASVDKKGDLKGELKPLSFVFEADDVMLPLQLMAGDGSLVTLTVYTASDEYTYIPGAEIQFAKKVDASHLKDAPALEKYDVWKKWLVRNVIQVETDEISADLSLLTTTDEKITVPGEQPIVLNPDLLPAETGVLVSDDGLTIYTEEEVAENSKDVEQSSKLTTTMVVLLSVSNVVLLGLLMSNYGSRKSTAKR